VNTTQPIRVLVADDHALVRAGLVSLLDSQPGFAVVGQAENGLQAVALARELVPDVVLMDIRMPVMDGLEATGRIVTESPCRVVILTTYDLDEYVYDALRAGACGFLLKHAPPEELLLGVRAANNGGALLSPSVTKRLIETFAARAPAHAPQPGLLDKLTSRERDVFGLLVKGRTNAEIARTLFIAETTAKTHVNHALEKLGLRDRVHAVVFAYENQLITPA
jgi:DNA-binding NarL/FixJ family response regulator